MTHTGIRAQVECGQSGNVKARRRPDAMPSRGMKRDSRDAVEDVTAWMHVATAARKGNADLGSSRRPALYESPPSYDLRRFGGHVESAEPRGAFRLLHEGIRPRQATRPSIPAVRGGSVERALPFRFRLSPRGAMIPCLR